MRAPAETLALQSSFNEGDKIEKTVRARWQAPLESSHSTRLGWFTARWC